MAAITAPNLPIDKTSRAVLLVFLTATMLQTKRNTNKLINSTFIATIGEAMALKQRGIEIHGLGIQLQSDTNAGLSKTRSRKQDAAIGVCG